MAGAGIKEIKTRMGSVNSTKQITKAMELVASSKLRKAKEQAESSDPYFSKLYETVQEIAQNTKDVRDPFLANRKVNNKCYIVVAGDRGLAGGYNANVLRDTVSHMDGKSEKVIAVGKKSTEYFTKRNYEVCKSIPNVEECGYEGSLEIANTAMDLYKKGEVDEVYISYTKFISPLVQEVQVVKVLPITVDEEAKKGKKSVVKYLPSPEAVLSYLVPKYVSSVIYGGILQSFASEQGARRTAMESATNNANDMLSQLELSYNRARQAAVTQEISEIVGGAEALN